jgi:2'-5' RNA ligase
VAAVLGALRPSLTIAPFDLELGGAGVFPRSGPPRVVWIGLTAGLASLRAMHDELNARLAPLGYEAERRDFSAHLTLARVKDVPRGAARSIREAVAAVPPLSVRCRVDSATLFQSHLSPNGPSYEALFEIPCTG